MNANKAAEALDEKKKRNTYTLEQRIENRKADIERMEAKRKAAVRDLMDHALEVLQDANQKATAAGMEAESRIIGAAIAALESKENA